MLPDDAISSPNEPVRLNRPCYRKRMGRGGRIYIDRIGFGTSHLESHGGKTKPSDQYERAVKRFKYDSDEMSDEEEEVDDMQDRYDKSYAINMKLCTRTKFTKKINQITATSMSIADRARPSKFGHYSVHQPIHDLSSRRHDGKQVEFVNC